MLGCVYALSKSKIWRTDQNRRRIREQGMFDIKLYKGMVGAIERRETTQVRGSRRKNHAQIKSGAVIWTSSFPQKSQQLPPSQCGAPKNKYTRLRGWDCVKHFIFRHTKGMLNAWVMVREKNFLTRIWTFQIQGQSVSNSEQCKSRLQRFLTRQRTKGSI